MISQDVRDSIVPTTRLITAALPPTEYSREFIQGMVNRMAVSWMKYGFVADAFPGKVSALESLIARLDKYRETGNTEWLIDAANFAMIEFMCPSIRGAHFTGTDSDQSPGRSAVDSSITYEPNDRL